MPDGRLVRHRKIHAFEHPAIHGGDRVHGVRHAARLPGGVLICYDNNIVENVRITALRGAEMLLAPHQTGGCRTSNPHLMGLVDRAALGQARDGPGGDRAGAARATRAAAG